MTRAPIVLGCLVRDQWARGGGKGWGYWDRRRSAWALRIGGVVQRWKVRNRAIDHQACLFGKQTMGDGALVTESGKRELPSR